MLRTYVNCFCSPGPGTVNPLSSEVRDGRIRIVRDSAGRRVRGHGDTVLDLFSEAERLARGRYGVVEVSFDSLLGYPARIMADERVDITDDHFVIEVRLTPLTGRGSPQSHVSQ